MAYTTIDKPTDYFNTVLYTGNGTDNHSITGVNFQPDFVWIKPRNEARGHHLQDVIRGVNGAFITNEASAEYTGLTNVIKSFDSDGFTLGTSNDVNKSSNTHVSWNWLASNTTASNTTGSINSTVSANTTSGFSIVSFTGNGVNDATIGHGLGTTPAMIITKNRADSVNWRVWHKNLPNATDVLFLNGTNSAVATSDHANGYIKTVGSATYSTHASNSDANGVNGDGDAMIAYCFAEKKGYSKFGSYTGNGNADGTFVYTGFKPAFVIFKRSSGTGNWQLLDNKRLGYNVENHTIYPNSNIAEQDETDGDILSNGFKLRNTGTDGNGSGSTYIYMAFAESPFVTSTGISTTAR